MNIMFSESVKTYRCSLCVLVSVFMICSEVFQVTASFATIVYIVLFQIDLKITFAKSITDRLQHDQQIMNQHTIRSELEVRQEPV
jgi:hypothetical protein